MDDESVAPSSPLLPRAKRVAGRGRGWGGGAANSLLKECVERPPTPDPSPPIRGGRGEETARRCIATISYRHLSVPDRRADGEPLRRIDDGVGVDAVVAVEVADGSGLAERLDAERLDAVAAYAAEPAQRRRMAVDHGHNAAVAWQRRQQLFDVAEMRHAAAVAPQFSRRGPARMQPVSRSDRQQADIAVAFADESNRLDRFGRHRAGIGD